MTLRTIDSLGDLAGRTCLVRCDLNVPLEGRLDHGRRPRPRVPADHRARCIDRGARSSRCSHLGRPDGAPDPQVLPRPGRHAARRTARRAGRLRADTVGPRPEAVAALGTAKSLLENLRFDAARDHEGRRASARPSPRSSPRSATSSSRTASAPCTASTPASTTSRSRCRAPPGCSSRPSSTC